MAMIDSGLGWKCDSDYYVENAGALVTYPNGVLNKTTTGGAIVGYIRNQLEWCCLQITSTDPDFCALSATNNSCTIVYQGGFDVDGITWYYTGMYNNTPSYNAIAYMGDYKFIMTTNASTTNAEVVAAVLTAAGVEFKKIVPSTDYVKSFVEGVEAETATRVNANKANIGTLSSLTTTDKTSTVSAINEVNGNVGTLSNLATIDKTNTVSAINEVNTKTSDLYAILGTYGSDVYGLQIDFENYTYTRLAGAAGKSRSFFDTVAPWKDMKRCNLADDGTVNAYYGDADYIEDGTNGQVMVEIPKFYYKMTPLKLDPINDSVGGYHTRKANYYISATKYEGFKTFPAFVRPDGTERDKAYVSAYEGCIYDVSASAYLLADEQVADFTATTGDKLSSIANAKPASGLTQNLTRANSEVLATNRGVGWHCMDVKAASAVQLLFMIEYATLNMQSAIGKGVVDKAGGTENESELTGQTSSLGNSTGMASGTNGLVSVSYRGVENPYGNMWTFVEGLTPWGDGTLRGGQPYICDDYTFAESVKTGYTAAKFTVTNTVGYISAFGYDSDFDWLFLPSECINADSNYPVGDYEFVTSNLNGYRTSQLGALWNAGVQAGAFYWLLANEAGYRHRGVGARLMYVS